MSPKPVKSTLRALRKWTPSPLKRHIRYLLSEFQNWRLSRRLIRRSSDVDLTKGKILILGLFSTRTGLGQSARMMLNSYLQAGYDVLGVDITKVLGQTEAITTSGVLPLSQLKNIENAIAIFHINPREYVHVLNSMLNRNDLLSWTLIGYWHWELDKVPDEWVKISNYANQIWVPNSFVAGAFGADLRAKKVKIVPHDLQQVSRYLTDLQVSKRLRGLIDAEGALVVGYSFAGGSNFYRKNPRAAHDVVDLVRSSGRNIKLILRFSDAKEHPELFKTLEDSLKGSTTTWVVDGGELSLPDFYSLIDVYLAMHRSEGYGLNIAEAALSGKKCIVNGYGLSPEIAALEAVHIVPWQLISVDDPQGHYHHVKGALWSDPDVCGAADLLSEIYDNHPYDRSTQTAH